MKAYKTIIYLILLVGFVSAFQYSYDSIIDSIILFNKSYLEKQDYIELNYNKYQVYRYCLWLDEKLSGKQYGLLVARSDAKSYARYLHRMNYFLYPKHLIKDSAAILFAPKLSSIGSKTVTLGNKLYVLKYTKDDTGVFIRK